MTYVVDYDDLQNRVKESLDRVLRDYLKHDWLEDGHTFPLMQYYTDLVWKRRVKMTRRTKEKSMAMDELLYVEGAGKVCVKILVEGRLT